MQPSIELIDMIKDHGPPGPRLSAIFFLMFAQTNVPVRESLDTIEII